jgi:hypothetical protein
MRGRPVNVVYDAVIRRPKQVSDRQGGDRTACRAHDGITSLGLTDIALPASWESMEAATRVGSTTEAWVPLWYRLDDTVVGGVVLRMLRMSCTKHYCSLPKKPQPHMTLTARSTRRADLLHSTPPAAPTPVHVAIQPTASISSGGGELGGEPYAAICPSDHQMPPPSHPSVPQLAVDISATRAPTMLVPASPHSPTAMPVRVPGASRVLQRKVFD